MNILRHCKNGRKAVSPRRKNGEGTEAAGPTTCKNEARISKLMFDAMLKFKRINMYCQMGILQ